MKKIRKLIKQYITCKHEEYVVMREIMCPHNGYKPKWVDRCKCKICDREYYSEFYYQSYGEKLFIK